MKLLIIWVRKKATRKHNSYFSEEERIIAVVASKTRLKLQAKLGKGIMNFS